MPIEFKEVETTDYSFVYYMFDLYTKTNCVLKYYTNNDDNFEANEIVQGLYLGNINSAYDMKTLKGLGIKNVISVIAGFQPPFPDDFNYLVINALDNENTDLSKNFEITNKFIEDAFENNEKILIHCMAGRSRSASVVIAYLIKVFGMNVKTSMDILKTKRNIVEPNKSFLKQLNNYYETLYRQNEND